MQIPPTEGGVGSAQTFRRNADSPGKLVIQETFTSCGACKDNSTTCPYLSKELFIFQAHIWHHC